MLLYRQAVFAIEKQDMPDYTQALQNDNNKAKYIGKISNGEKGYGSLQNH